MRIEVVGRRFQVTEEVREYAEKKSDRLGRYFNRVQQITWTLDKENTSREVVSVEIVIDVEHHREFVARSDGDDVHAVIDAAVDKASRQLTDYKEKLKLGNR